MKIQEIDFSYMYKARNVFERFRKNLATDQDKAGAVQAYEFCYELAWKLMKRVLQSRGLEVGSPKDTFRKAFEEGLIDNPETWFGFLQTRQLTVHVYEEKNLNIVVGSLDKFSQEFSKLMVTIKSQN